MRFISACFSAVGIHKLATKDANERTREAIDNFNKKTPKFVVIFQNKMADFEHTLLSAFSIDIFFLIFMVRKLCRCSDFFSTIYDVWVEIFVNLTICVVDLTRKPFSALCEKIDIHKQWRRWYCDEFHFTKLFFYFSIRK